MPVIKAFFMRVGYPCTPRRHNPLVSVAERGALVLDFDLDLVLDLVLDLDPKDSNGPLLNVDPAMSRFLSVTEVQVKDQDQVQDQVEVQVWAE